MGTHRKTATAIVSTAKDGTSAHFSMFEAKRVTADGAFLTGPLLLEEKEQLTLELSLPNGTVICITARVMRVPCGEDVGMEVRFEGLSDEQKGILSHGRND